VSERAEPGTADRRRAWVGLAITVVGLAAFDVVRAEVLPSGWHVPASVVAALVLLVIARAGGLTRRELGLGRGAWREGLRLGAVAFGAVTVVLALAAALPWTRGAFDDPAADVSVAGLLLEALIAIPLGTVLLEEVAFRGSVLAFGRRLTSRAIAVAGSSLLFGVWHVVPALTAPAGTGPLATAGADRPVSVLTTVALTTIAGVVFCWLRLRSGSLVAPFLAHVATNSVGFALAWVIVR
jgi:membrane protease YdiL (CAAX protease family)